MPYSECCGAFRKIATEINTCPECKQYTDWVYDADIENEHIDKEESEELET